MMASTQKTLPILTPAIAAVLRVLLLADGCDVGNTVSVGVAFSPNVCGAAVSSKVTVKRYGMRPHTYPVALSSSAQQITLLLPMWSITNIGLGFEPFGGIPLVSHNETSLFAIVTLTTREAVYGGLGSYQALSRTRYSTKVRRFRVY
jgi:putative exporter of polyketide antibiotics